MNTITRAYRCLAHHCFTLLLAVFSLCALSNSAAWAGNWLVSFEVQGTYEQSGRPNEPWSGASSEPWEGEQGKRIRNFLYKFVAQNLNIDRTPADFDIQASHPKLTHHTL